MSGAPASAGAGPRRLLVLADGEVFEGEAIGAVPATGRRWSPARPCSTPSWPATRRSSRTPPTPGRSSPSPTPTSGTTGSTPTDDEAARPFCRGVVVRDLATRPSNWRATGTWSTSSSATASRGSPGWTPGGSPGTCATRGHAVRLRDRVRGRPPGRAARAAPSTDGLDLVSGVTTAGGLHPGRRSLPGGGLRLRHQGDHAALAGRAGHRHRGPGPTPADEVLALGPDGVLLSNGPGDPAALPGSSPRSATAGPARPGVRHLPGPPAAGHRTRARPPTSCPSATTVATTPCGGWPPAGWRSPRRTTTTRSPRARCPGPTSPTST